MRSAGTSIGSCRFVGQSAISHGRQCQLSPTIGNDSICRRGKYTSFRMCSGSERRLSGRPEHMDFGRTGHGEGERFLPLDGRNLSCCLRPPVIDRWLSSGQKRDGADGSSRQNPSARRVFPTLFARSKSVKRFDYK